MKDKTIGAREAARRYLETIVSADPDPARAAESQAAALAAADRLSSEDRGLFQELTLGTLREWRYLDWLLSSHAKREPRGLLRTVIHLAAYQLLFLERVPAYAVFSEAAEMGRKLGFSEPELKFVHGVVKTIERERDDLLKRRSQSLEAARGGESEESEFVLAALNAGKPLLDSLTIVEGKGASKKAARARAIKALAAMKDRLPLVGYTLGDNDVQALSEPLKSGIAPGALIFESGERLLADLKAGNVRIQGEASQWACESAAAWLLEFGAKRGKEPLRVLEMAAGKGGKLLGTLERMSRMVKRDGRELPSLEWFAVDASEKQLKIFETDTMAVAGRLWPNVTVHAYCSDWRDPVFEKQGFDFVWLDAPCTGFGTLAKLPQIALTRGVNAYEESLKISTDQKRLLGAGSELLRKGGLFYYTVCTLAWPETLGIVKYGLDELGLTLKKQEWLWPGSEPAPRAEGFFAALFG